jgi:hypothetical protein
MVWDDINNTIGTQLSAATKTIMDLRANLTHITKVQAVSEAAAKTRMDEIEHHLSSPLTPRDRTVVDPSVNVVDPSTRECTDPPTPPPRRHR